MEEHGASTCGLVVAWMSQHEWGFDGANWVSTDGGPMDILTVQLAEFFQDHHYVCV